MPNPFFNRLVGNGGMNMPGPLGNLMNMISQYRQFKSQFQGDPKEQVQQLLNSGQMTQEQYNQLSNMAAQFQNFVK